MADADFAKGPAGVATYDTSASGLGIAPTFLAPGSTATASASSSPGAGSVVVLASWPPSAPLDGEAAVLELPSTYDPVGGKTIRWSLIYNAGDSVWDFIGGPPLYAEVTTAETLSSGTYGDLATSGPALALPRAGDYIVEIGFSTTQPANNTGDAIMSYNIGGTGAVDADAVGSYGATNAAFSSNARSREKAGLTAVTLTAKYKWLNANNNVSCSNRFIKVLPVRLT